MKVLLDTHVFLWFIAGDRRLTTYGRELIETPTNQRLVSIASLWEIAIKASLGSLKLGMSVSRLVQEHVHGNAMELLAIAPFHLDCLGQLPFHHRDPFDRLLIAQAQVEQIPILTRDESFRQYAVTCLWRRPQGEEH